MMALQVMLILEVIVILFSPSSGYPIYGTKSQTYPDEYYPQESYPMYYPPARTSKYEVYQAVLPYYYPNYGYYENDPVVNLQEEMIQEAEREEREDAQPIGHELLYEDQSEDLDDVNAAFLQNLIMTQMYKDAIDNQDEYYPEEDFKHRQEDEDVRELKQLAKAKPKPNTDDIHGFQRSHLREKPQKRTSTEAPKRDSRGQKEEVLMRPATPVRHPFSSPVLEMMSTNDEKRAPSVYDTIKHMLDMEKSLEKKYGENAIRPQMKKRIITSEENLARQLTVLKKQQ